MVHRVLGVIAVSAQLEISLPLAFGQNRNGGEVIFEMGFAAANSHVEGWRRRCGFRACSYAARGLSSFSWSLSTCRAVL